MLEATVLAFGVFTHDAEVNVLMAAARVAWHVFAKRDTGK